MSETISGEGPWRVLIRDGQVYRVEILTEDSVMVFGSRPYTVTCRDCGDQMPSSTPDNVDNDLCATCEEDHIRRHGAGS